MTISQKINAATHSLKILDSRNKQTAIRSKLNNLGHSIFASHLLPIKYFASPSNAADIKIARIEALEANEKKLTIEQIGEYIPSIEDGKIKQVLLPFENDYISITPTPNLHVIENLNQYGWAIRSNQKQCIQPIPAAITNHGDPLITNRGYVNLIHNTIPKLKKRVNTCFDSAVIIITARCEGMNVSSSYVSTGLPHLTAIGGFIHSIERALNINLAFGFGIKAFDHSSSNKKGHSYFKNLKNMTKAADTILITDEINCNAEIAFIFNQSDQETLEKIKNHVENVNRFAGGSLFDVDVNLTNSIDGYFWYMRDPEENIDLIELPEELDYTKNLQSDFVEKYQIWESEFPNFASFLKATFLNYKLIQSGYALLNVPKVDRVSRADSRLHAWGEPVFSLILLGNEPTFFQLEQNNGLFIWQ